VNGSTLLLFAVCFWPLEKAVRRQPQFTLRWPAEINLSLEDHGAFLARPHVTVQPAAGSLVPSDQNTNLS